MDGSIDASTAIVTSPSSALVSNQPSASATYAASAAIRAAAWAAGLGLRSSELSSSELGGLGFVAEPLLFPLGPLRSYVLLLRLC
jgi:hypothetical protein